MPTTPPEQPSPVEPSGWSPGIGSRVQHRRFGEGTVRRVDGRYSFVNFDAHGLKQLETDRSRLAQADPTNPADRVSPSWGEVRNEDTFAPPLTSGELELATFFDSTLPKSWRIYVRPHLDGDLPSIALLSQGQGAMLWDVVEPFDPTQSPPPVSAIGRTPIQRLERIRQRIYNEYIPELGEQIVSNRSRFGAVRLGAYFPNHDRFDVVAHSTNKADVAVTRSELVVGAVARVVPILSRRDWLTADEWARFDALFSHYSTSPAALDALTLRKDQEALAQPAAGHSVIRGVAGSGKSVVLAHRAVRNAMAGRRVLVLTFNRTLTNYMRHLISTVQGRYPQQRITVRHFHEVCLELRRRWPYRDGFRESDTPDLSMGIESESDHDQRWFEEGLPNEALRALDEGVPDRLRFDSVLIDEGQDFSLRYLEVAEKLASGPSPEVVIATDEAQRLYQRESAMSDVAAARRYRKTRSMTAGVRSPRAIADVANAFIKRWQLETPPIEAPPEGLGLDRPLVAWREASAHGEVAALAVDLVLQWIGPRGIRPDKIAILVSSKAAGAALVQLLAEKRVAANHIFAVGMTGAPMDESAPAPQGEREQIAFVTNKKKAFRVEDQRLKVSTVHSFKGWESHRVICLLASAGRPDERQLASLYVALTRSRQDVAFIGVHDPYGLSTIIPDRLDDVAADPTDAERFTQLVEQAKQSESAVARVRVRREGSLTHGLPGSGHDPRDSG